MIWLRRIWTMLQSYWLAYLIVAGMSFVFLSLSIRNWAYVIVWALVLAVMTAIFVFRIARDELDWDDAVRSVSDDARIPASGSVFGCVRSGPFAGHVLMIVASTAVTDLVIRMRPLDLLRWREIRVTGAKAADLAALIDEGVVGLIDDGRLSRRLKKIYFPGDRSRPDRCVKMGELRGELDGVGNPSGDVPPGR